MASTRKSIPSRLFMHQNIMRKEPLVSLTQELKGTKDLLRTKVRSLTRQPSVSSPPSPKSSLAKTNSLIHMKSVSYLPAPRNVDHIEPVGGKSPDFRRKTEVKLKDKLQRTASKPQIKILENQGDVATVGLSTKGHIRSLTQITRPNSKSQTFRVPVIPPLVEPLASEHLENVVTRCAFKTRTGAVLCRPKKHNQDSYIINPSFGQVRGQYLFAVCDGHGTNGHDVSGLIKEALPRFVSESVPTKVRDDDFRERFSFALQEGLRKVVGSLRKSKIDISFSGSTCVSVIISGNELICANVGDSRALLVKKIDGKWTSEPLSTDHKPDLTEEYERIITHGGRVSPYREVNGEAVGPARVWMANQGIPGLAMSRSIGDTVASEAGVISDPELKHVKLSPEDKIVVLGSDGLWEFLGNQEVAQIVGEHWESGDLEGSCDRLVRESLLRWKQEDDVVDDITVILIYLKVLD